MKNCTRMQCNTENFVPIVVPGLSTSSSSSSHSSTSMTPSKQEIDHPTSSSSSSTSPTTTVSNDSAARAREDLCGIDSHPVTVSSEHVERRERWDPLTKPTKNPKPNKNEDHELERWDLLNSDIPEWLQEFRENLVDDRVSEHRDSHASSSHEPSLEPTLRLREVRIWVNTVFILTSRKTEIPRSVRGPIVQVPRAEDTMAEPYLVQKIWVTWLQQITKFSVKVVNLETIIDMQSWCRTWPPNGSSRIRAKQKLLRKHKGACKSSWNPRGSLKSFTLTIPWNLAKPVKIFPGIIVPRHHTDRKQMGLVKERCAEWKMALLLYCCNQVWMEIGGQILWNVIPICETFKISCLMGKLHARDVLENHLKDRSFRLVHWLSITLHLRRTSQESINLERKYYLDCSLDTLCTRGEFGRVTYWLQTLRSWKRWTPQKSTLKDSMLRMQYFTKKMENLFFQSQMDESNFLEEIRTWEHPPWYGNTQFEEKVTEIFLENQKGLFHHLKTHFRMRVKR